MTYDDSTQRGRTWTFRGTSARQRRQGVAVAVAGALLGSTLGLTAFALHPAQPETGRTMAGSTSLTVNVKGPITVQMGRTWA